MKFDVPAADEWRFVFDSWANSFRKSPWAGCIPNNLYDQVSRATASDIIARPGARTVVCTIDLPEGGRRVMGYAVAEPRRSILHWAFVKKDYRRLGIAKTLVAEVTGDFPDGRKFYTHKTRLSHKLLRERDGWEWDPVFARVKGA
jgi:GNAT superfamily N-acetyltransferase